MRHLWLTVIALLVTAYVTGSVVLPVTPKAQATPQTKVLTMTTSDSEVVVTAPAYAVIDMETGELLVVKNETELRSIASVTKLFTAAAITDVAALDARIKLDWADLEAYGTAGRLQAGETYSYRELLFPLLLSSSNDAAYALRRHDSKGELLQEMEQLAHQYGAKQATFADASGLAAQNQATAAGLARWLKATYRTYATVYDITRIKHHVGPHLGWQNNSPFWGVAGYRGGKHGYTTAAGRTAAVVFAEEFGDTAREVGYVVLGSDNLLADVATLRTHVYRSVE